MSLLKSPAASPSRIYAVLALTMTLPGRSVEVEALKQMMSPKAFQSTDKKETDFIGATLPEMATLGLIHQDNGIVLVPDSLPIKEWETSDRLATALSHLIRERLTSDDGGANADLIQTIAWYMTQNPYQAPGNWREVEEALFRQINSKLECTSDARYGQFEDWATYMGFTAKVQNKLIPDPTRVIRQLLPVLFESKRTLYVDDIVRKLAKLCSIFEGGQVREALRKTYGLEPRLEGQLSQATSLAWLRLHEEQTITLAKKSDADVYLFNELQNQHRYSEITWNGQEAK